MRTPLLETATVTLVVTAVGLSVLYVMQNQIAQMFANITRVLP